jgi:carbamate kinase
MIGYYLESELRNCLPTSAHLCTVLTQVEVDPLDPAFQTPTKPIGPFYEEIPPQLRALDFVHRDGKYRRVVASPLPQKILE